MIEERSTLTSLSVHHTLFHWICQEVWWFELYIAFLVLVVFSSGRTMVDVFIGAE